MAATDFSIGDVLAWARTKPAGERYNYGDNENCALCHFLRETGRCATPFVGGYGWSVSEAEWDPGTPQFQLSNRLGNALVDGGWTYGGLAKRLEKLVPETPITRSDWTRLDAYLTEQVAA